MAAALDERVGVRVWRRVAHLPPRVVRHVAKVACEGCVRCKVSRENDGLMIEVAEHVTRPPVDRDTCLHTH